MDVPKIFESEYRFCLILWEREPMSFGELIKLCIEDGSVSSVDWLEEATFTNWSNFATLFFATDLQQVWKDQPGTSHVQETTDLYPGIPLQKQRYSFTEDGLVEGYQKIFYNEAGEEFSECGDGTLPHRIRRE